MSHYLRVVSLGRWQPAVDYVQPDGDLCHPPIMADILGDMRSQNNALSVYLTEDDPEKNLAVAVGLGALRKDLNHFDYVLLDRQILDELLIETRQTPGESLHADANSLHYDLVNLTFFQLTRLIEKTCCSNFVLRRIIRAELAGHIDSALRQGQIAHDKLHSSLLADIGRMLRTTQ